MLAYLKTVDSGRDDVSVRRIINVPKRGIGATTIEKIAAFADDAGLGFYEACGMADEIPGLGKAASKVLAFVNLIDSFRKCLEENGPTETLKMIVDETDYQNELKEEDADDASERIGNIDELINTLRQFEDDEPEGTLSQFLEDAALVSDLDSADEDTSRVMLMTVHSAKGLEFPRVFLCGMEDGVFPSPELRTCSTFHLQGQGWLGARRSTILLAALSKRYPKRCLNVGLQGISSVEERAINRPTDHRCLKERSQMTESRRLLSLRRMPELLWHREVCPAQLYKKVPHLQVQNRTMKWATELCILSSEKVKCLPSRKGPETIR